MTMQTISFAIFSIIVMVLAFIVLWKIWTDEISLKGLLSETSPPGTPASDIKASLSRFQMLVFTFVIAGLFTMLSMAAHGFVEIPQNVLILLGISGGTYVVSKGVSASGSKP
jgi:hypothetical protein